MTPYTSLVAVDSVVSNPSGAAIGVEVPVELPLGVSREGIFGKIQGAIVGGTSVAAQGPALMAQPTEVARNEPERLRYGQLPQASLESASQKVEADRIDWERVVWLRGDGSRVIVERDGDVWEEREGRRVLLRTLSTQERAALDPLVRAAADTSWGQGGAGPSLTLVIPSGTRSVPLPTADPALRALAEAVERAARMR